MISKYKTKHILLTNVHLNCRGEGSSYRNASRDESVETRDESIKAGEKNNHVIITDSLYGYVTGKIVPLSVTEP